MSSLVKRKCFGYAVVVCSCLLYCMGMIAAQILGKTYPRFELNVLRFAACFVVFSLVCIALKVDIFQMRKAPYDIAILVGAATAFTWTVFSMNLAPVYAPVGNVESVGITVFLVCNVICAVARRTASIWLVLAALLCCVGVVCLSQPDYIFPGAGVRLENNDPCPCSTLQHDEEDAKIQSCRINGTDDYLSHSARQYGERMNHDQIYSDMISENLTGFEYEHFASSNVTGEEGSILEEMSSETYGYLLMVSCGVTFFIYVQVTGNVLIPRGYHVMVLLFWYSLVGIILSTILMLAVETPILIGGSMCILFLIVHLLCAVGSTFCTITSLMFVTPEENSLLNTAGIVFLFIAQSTVLVDFHPPRKNAPEYIGACLIIVGCLVEPLGNMLCYKKKKENDDKKTKTFDVSSDSETSDTSVNEKSFLLNVKFEKETGKKYGLS